MAYKYARDQKYSRNQAIVPIANSFHKDKAKYHESQISIMNAVKGVMAMKVLERAYRSISKQYWNK
jgi:hypothetical protein